MCIVAHHHLVSTNRSYEQIRLSWKYGERENANIPQGKCQTTETLEKAFTKQLLKNSGSEKSNR